MIVLLDNIINNYLNILSLLVLIYIIGLNKNNYFIIILIDILFNVIPIISIIILLLHYLYKYLFKYIRNNSINIILFLSLCYYITITILFFINKNNFSYIFYLKKNIISFIFNIIIYYLYIIQS